MKIAVFTSNHPRHLGLIETLAGLADQVFAVQESKTMFPGQEAGMYARSDITGDYFSHVTAAEGAIFGAPRFLPANVRQMAFSRNDINHFDVSIFAEALEADAIVVFGASYINGALCDALVARKAINIHMGVSPYYRGNSCNFWPLYDGKPEFVGATIHYLSAGLDSGPMLFHALPQAEAIDPFALGMKAVRAAHRGLADRIASGEVFEMTSVPQDAEQELRYTRAADFTEQVSSEFLARRPSPEAIGEDLASRQLDQFVRPYIG